MPLTAPSVDYAAIEGTTLALWDEWLRGYFDGAAHAMGATAAVTFPPVTVRHQQSGRPQPADGISLSVVMLNPTEVWQCWETIGGATQQIAQSPVTFQLWVRASGMLSGSASPEWHASRAAELLFALLANSATHHALAQKGIMRLKVRSPEPVVEKEFSTRLVTVRATLRYPIFSQT